MVVYIKLYVNTYDVTYYFTNTYTGYNYYTDVRKQQSCSK